MQFFDSILIKICLVVKVFISGGKLRKYNDNAFHLNGQKIYCVVKIVNK